MENEKEEKMKICRHSLAHVLAKAVKRFYPSAKLAIGPAIENGFYYDFDMDESIKQEDYLKIEKEMQEIMNKGEAFIRKEISKEDARKLFADEKYKLEMLEEHDVLSIYYLGNDFVDLCAGPHVENSTKIQNWAYKISRVSGAYWKGNEKNKMLQRVYCYAFPIKKELNDYIEMQEQAKLRDHNKLGRELELFTTCDIVGQGLPILLPKGAKIIQILQRFVEDYEAKHGWQLTKTPLMAKSDLYKLSGHWDHYKDGMFVMGDESKDEEVFALRPMTCPFQYQCYLNRSRSYKDLPIRYDETSTLFRNEASGEMHGLIRVRQFTISEGHALCTPEQLESEFKSCVEMAVYMLKTLGLYEDASYRFSQWDPNDREKYIGTKEQWDEAQDTMEKILQHLNIPYFVGIGEAAFYGPKLDIQVKNVWGKEDTLITIQIDQMLAETFGMVYTDKDGVKKTPYIIHRTSIGCYERTLAYLIEKFAGAFPVWLAPVQVIVMNVSEKSEQCVEQVYNKLFDADIRVEKDIRAEKIGYKIREASQFKVPYIVILGENEAENGTVSIRMRGNVEKKDIKVEDLIEMIKNDVENKR